MPYARNHKPLYLNLTLSHSINKCGAVKEERRYIIRPCYNKAMIYAKEVENHLSKLSLGNDVKENWKHLKDVILEVGYQYFQRRVIGHIRSSFPCNSWFDEECKMCFKPYKFVKGESEWIMAWHQYKKVLRRKKRKEKETVV